MSLRTGVALALVGLVCLATFATPVAAQAKFQIESADTVKSLLERHMGRPVRVRLQSGEEMGGTVTKVGEHVVQLSELAGREFFDAVIRLDSIRAVILRTRGN
jgi:hypothetical protein